MLLLVIYTQSQQKDAPVEVAKMSKREAKQIADEQYKRATETLDFEMIFVEGGAFTMGCTDGDCIVTLMHIELGKYVDFDWEKPAHQVTVGSFHISKYEVTQAQWVAVMGGKITTYYKGDNLPAYTINWYDAQEFIRKLNAMTGKQYRLPTEAEWEYAARGGNKSQGYKYSGSNTFNEVARIVSAARPYPVGSMQPNELGIYNMSGNVGEWCYDWFGTYSSDAKINPQGPPKGERRIVRGGDIAHSVQLFRVSSRFPTPPDRRTVNGFRLVHP